MLVKVEQLEKGDEILCPQSGKFILIRVIRPAHPLYQKDKAGNRIPKLDGLGHQRYSSIYGSTNADVKEWTTSNTWGGVTTNYNHRQVTYIPTTENHNFEKNFTLNYSHIWLLNRRL